jgi:hypothetical protein
MLGADSRTVSSPVDIPVHEPGDKRVREVCLGRQVTNTHAGALAEAVEAFGEGLNIQWANLWLRGRFVSGITQNRPGMIR